MFLAVLLRVMLSQCSRVIMLTFKPMERAVLLYIIPYYIIPEPS